MTYYRVIKKKWYLFSQSKIIVLKTSENKEEIRYILKFYYKKGKNTTQAAKKNLWCCNDASCKRAVPQKLWLRMYRKRSKIADQHLARHAVWGRRSMDWTDRLRKLPSVQFFRIKRRSLGGKITPFAGQQSWRSAESAILSLLCILERTSQAKTKRSSVLGLYRVFPAAYSLTSQLSS